MKALLPRHSPDTSASQLLTVYGCVTRIADVMATMAVDHYMKRGDLQAELTCQQRASWLDRPNVDNDWASFMTQVMWSLLIDGNTFLVPIRNAAGACRGDLRPRPDQGGSAPRVRSADGARRWPSVHRRSAPRPAYMRPGDIRGVNPIENARTALALGIRLRSTGPRSSPTRPSRPSSSVPRGR